MFADEIAGNIYSRYSNPNTNEFISKLCVMEGTEDGIATSSGMAAMWSSMAALLKSGDHVLASRSVFGSTHQILNTIFPRFGITYSYADIDQPVLNVARLLLRANQKAFDFVIRNRRIVGSSADPHVIAGAAEQIDGGLLQTAVRNGEPQCSILTQSQESISGPGGRFPV